MNNTADKPILTITGSDPAGGSGVQADVKTIAQLGGYAVSAITSITVQNTLGIQGFYDLPASVVRGQIEAIINDVEPLVVKVGLIRRIDTVEAVVDVLRRHRQQHIVYAPVLRSTAGEQLVSPEVYETIERLLLPLCTVVLEPSDLPVGKRRHGSANQLASAVAVFLNRGETPADAMLHARAYLKELPAGYATTDGRSAELYNRFLDCLGRFCHRYSDVAFYAAQLNVSTHYLAQVTRRIAQRSPKQIIDERITAEVTTLLTTSTMPLKDVAHSMGFSSQAQLSRFFRKQKGLSPTTFRERERTSNVI